MVTLGLNMNVRLTPEAETLVQTKLKTGLYPSATELVSEAVRLLDRRDRAGRRRAREIREQIEEGWFSLRQGHGLDGEEFFRALARRERCLTQKRKHTPSRG
jgi:antitoxin ParD1/3/4